MLLSETALHPRDPDARRRATALLVAIVVLWPLLVIAQFNPAILFDARNLATMGAFLKEFLPPAMSAEFLGVVVRSTFETLAIATTGITLAFVVAVPLALALTRSLSVSRIGPGPGYWRGTVLRGVVRGVLTILRGVPELVWALVFVRVFGLGPAAAVLALGITYGGMLGKVYAEILESTDTMPARALLEGGSRTGAALLYGLLPNAAQEIVSYTVYRWECAIRASVMMGFVGAGGLGQLMDQSMKLLNGGEVATILIVFLFLVQLADAISAHLRKQLA